MTRVFIHPLAGVLSAYGMGLADVRALRQQAVEARLDGAALAATATRRSPRSRAPRAPRSRRRASPPTRIDATRTLHLKYDGTDTTLELAARHGAPTTLHAEFERALPRSIRLPDARHARWSSRRSRVEAVGRTQSAADERADVRAARRRRSRR